MGKKKEAPASVETLAKETLKAKRVIEKEDSREERKKSKAEMNAKLGESIRAHAPLSPFSQASLRLQRL